MAHADYRMKGRCHLCEEMQFIGVCPHGMAERVERPLAPAPTITPEEIEEALKKAIPGAKELDKKLEKMFGPPRPSEGSRAEEWKFWLAELAREKKAKWQVFADQMKPRVLELLGFAEKALKNGEFEEAHKLLWKADKVLHEIRYDWWFKDDPKEDPVIRK